jgi:hypothetical protein
LLPKLSEPKSPKYYPRQWVDGSDSFYQDEA